MTKEFLMNHRLALTPLAPIHIGLGEEFEPTEYIIDPEKKLLYAFDPSQAPLPENVRQELLRLAEAGRPENIHQIYTLIRENKEHFLPCAHSVIPVSSGVAQKYQESLGRPVRTESDLRIFNSNYIERAISLAEGQPFIPGSGVKGAIRTSWLEALNQETAGFVRPQDFEKTVLGGDFQTSPFRLLKIADFMPEPDRAVGRKIVFACNYKKKQVKVNGQPTLIGRGPSTRKEVILPGQFRLFQADLTLVRPEKMGLKDKTPAWRPEVKDMARHCLAYYRPRLDKELKIIHELRLVNQVWADRLKDLLSALQNDFDSGRAFILRLGRYGDAETKTVADLARIKILGAKGAPPRYAKETTTLWLAAEQDKAKRDLLPFGWALAEIDPDPENSPLRAFCAAESQGQPDLGGLRSRLDETKIQLKAEQEARKIALETEKARKEAEEAAREAEKKALAALPPELALLEEFRRRLEIMNPLKPREAGAAILAEGQKFMEDALAWPEPERQKCAEILAPLFKAKNMFIGSREKRLRELLKELRGPSNA